MHHEYERVERTVCEVPYSCHRPISAATKVDLICKELADWALVVCEIRSGLSISPFSIDWPVLVRK